MEKDKIFLKEAVQLACQSVQSGGGPFGALVVKGEQVVGRGMNRVTDHHDPTAHAEIQAIREAGNHLGHHHLYGCTLYASCEPCPMCLGAIYWARIDRVVFASNRNEAAYSGFLDAHIYEEMARDPEARELPFEHLEVDGAGEEFRLWQHNQERTDY